MGSSKHSIERPNHQLYFYAILGVLFACATCVAFLTDGTNGGGDSVNHFLIAHYAWQHPFLFFDHWGKPVFTILSSPFAMLGMNWLKFFNVIAYLGAVAITFSIVKTYSKINPLWVLPLFFCAPEGIYVMLSGLTEPLFALLFVAALWFAYENKFVPSILIASFLPLSRSEGLVILIVFFVFLLFNKKYLLLPLALFGQLVISILGYPVYGDILWVFNKIPYASLQSNYESGTFLHYFDSMPGVFGIVSTVLLYIGCIAYLYNTITRIIIEKSLIKFVDFRFIVYGSFLAFILSHAVFHYLGIFHDMGLTRVFIAIFPAMVIISIDGLVFVKSQVKSVFKSNLSVKTAGVIILFGMIYFCYVGSVYALKYKKHFSIDESQMLYRDKVIPYLLNRHPDKQLYYSDVSIPFYGKIDPYQKGNRFSNEISILKPNYSIADSQLIIWDSWYSVVEEHIPKDTLFTHPNLKVDTVFSTIQGKNKLEVIVFKKP
jgi:hypothetical protein